MAIDNSIATSQLAIDANSLTQLNTLSKQDPQQALKGAAQQFEAMFMTMLMKSMRDATPQDGVFDSEQTKLYQGMLDQQMAQTMAKRGVGLAAVMVKQLSNNMSVQDAARAANVGGVNLPANVGAVNPAANAGGTGASGNGGGVSMSAINDGTSLPALIDAMGVSTTPAADPTARDASAQNAGDSLRSFADRMWPHAADASQATGIPAHFMLGQAALETGWGKHEIKGADGTPSYNLFNIKAGRNWTGPTVSATTTEYVNGIAVKSTEKFRAYSSYAESFRDYANMLANNPRYAAVLQNTGDAAGFAKSLQQAGYATDPQYADKLARIINGNVLRQSLSA